MQKIDHTLVLININTFLIQISSSCTLVTTPVEIAWHKIVTKFRRKFKSVTYKLLAYLFFFFFEKNRGDLVNLIKYFRIQLKTGSHNPTLAH